MVGAGVALAAASLERQAIPPAPMPIPMMAMMIAPTSPNSDSRVLFADEGATISPTETPEALLQSTV